MGRKPEPPPVNLENLWKNGLRDVERRSYVWFLRSSCAIEDALNRQEVAPPVATLHNLRCLRMAQKDGRFDEAHWRQSIRASGETVEVPALWIDSLVKAWDDYALNGEKIPFDEAFGANAAPGKGSARAAAQKLILYWDLANALLQERIDALGQNDEVISIETAIDRFLTRQGEDFPYSEDTLKRAWERWGALAEALACAQSNRPPE